MTYQEAQTQAQARADSTGLDHGVLGPDFFGDWSVAMLPPKRSRFGHELRCEVRMCSDLAKCRPGHGPLGEAK